MELAEKIMLFKYFFFPLFLRFEMQGNSWYEGVLFKENTPMMKWKQQCIQKLVWLLQRWPSWVHDLCQTQISVSYGPYWVSGHAVNLVTRLITGWLIFRIIAILHATWSSSTFYFLPSSNGENLFSAFLVYAGSRFCGTRRDIWSEEHCWWASWYATGHRWYVLWGKWILWFMGLFALQWT